MAELNYPGDNHKPQSRKYNVQSHRGRCRGFIGGKEFSTFEKFEVRGIRSNDEWVLPIWSLFWSQCCAMERFYISDNHNYNNMATGIHVHAYSCPTVCDPTECSPPGSSVHGTLQARILEWVTISFSRGSSWPRDQTQFSRIGGRHFNLWITREAPPKFRCWSLSG